MSVFVVAADPPEDEYWSFEPAEFMAEVGYFTERELAQEFIDILWAIRAAAVRAEWEAREKFSQANWVKANKKRKADTKRKQQEYDVLAAAGLVGSKKRPADYKEPAPRRSYPFDERAYRRCGWDFSVQEIRAHQKKELSS